MVGQEGGAGETSGDTAANIDDGCAVPTCQLLDVTHDEELKQHCHNQLKQPATQSKHIES